MSGTAGIADVTLRVDEQLASDADFVGIHASVDCRGFSGHTAFTISRRDMQRFLTDAASVSADAGDLAVLLGGWDDREERMRLQIARTRRAHRLVVRVQMATTGPRPDQWNRVETEFIASPGQLQEFLDDLRRLIDAQARASASLTGEGDAVA